MFLCFGTFPFHVVSFVILFLYHYREALSNIWVNLFHGSDSDVAVTEKRRRVTIATVWFILTLVLALVSPDIGSVINILGSLAAIFIFVFPGTSNCTFAISRTHFGFFFKTYDQCIGLGFHDFRLFL